MLFTQESVKAALRSQGGKRVFWLFEGDRLTPSAKAWLEQEGIETVCRGQKPLQFQDLFGGCYTQKPEELTHLSGQLLVPKTHRRIAFRGELDSLQAELLLAIHLCKEKDLQRRALEQMLALCRTLMRADVLDEPLKALSLGGMTEQELRDRSHYPQRYYDQGHFQPEGSDSFFLLLLNRLRTLIRRTELSCCRAFSDADGKLQRRDLVQALNRLSSYCYLLMIEEKAGEDRHSGLSIRREPSS